MKASHRGTPVEKNLTLPERTEQVTQILDTIDPHNAALEIPVDELYTLAKRTEVEHFRNSRDYRFVEQWCREVGARYGF